MENSAKTILLVEDEHDISEILSLILRKAGYTVRAAFNGEEGLQEAIKHRPDLILTDVLMPVMDGYAFIKELKRLKVTAGIPVIVLTARGQMEDALVTAGASEFLEKPADKEVLLGKIEHWLDRSRATPENRTKVLIAGVYPEVLEAMAGQLTERECWVESVGDGAKVISHGSVFCPDVFVLDVQMPSVSTEDVIPVLRRLPEFRRTPIILYSYYRLTELSGEETDYLSAQIDRSWECCLQVGANLYIGRYDETTFLSHIEDYLRK